MSTAWFNRLPGEGPGIVAPLPEEPEALLLASQPDWIRLPPELGGRQERVQEVFLSDLLGDGQKIIHYRLETVSVAEHPTKGFLWYRPR